MNDNIGRRFLEEVDSYVKNNLPTLTCMQVYDFYYRFFYDLKKFKGNSNGFTGLSEYLIFRSLYHLLGGSFESRKVSGSNWINEFVSIDNNQFRIGQGVPVNINGKKLYPDIIVYKDDRLRSVAQIKLYLTSGIKELITEMEKYKALIAKYGYVKAFLIVFGLSKEGKIFPHLRELQDKEPWFNFVILENNENLIITMLTNGLGLKELIGSNNK